MASARLIQALSAVIISYNSPFVFKFLKLFFTTVWGSSM